jgi:hypothetical protein
VVAGKIELTAYEIIGVDPHAPAELVAHIYWMAAADLQAERSAGKQVDDQLHLLTRAYEAVSTPERRAQYDDFIGHNGEPVIKRKLSYPRRSMRQRLLRRQFIPAHVNYYEFLGLLPNAPTGQITDAYRIMRDYYLKAPVDKHREILMRHLEDAVNTLSDANLRAAYDEKRARRAKDSPARVDAVIQEPVALAPAPAQEPPATASPPAPARVIPSFSTTAKPEPSDPLDEPPPAGRYEEATAGKAVASSLSGLFRVLVAPARIFRSGAPRANHRQADSNEPAPDTEHHGLLDRFKAAPAQQASDEEVERALIERLAGRVEDAERRNFN